MNAAIFGYGRYFFGVVDESDNFHLAAAFRTKKRVDVIDLLDPGCPVFGYRPSWFSWLSKDWLSKKYGREQLLLF